MAFNRKIPIPTIHSHHFKDFTEVEWTSPTTPPGNEDLNPENLGDLIEMLIPFVVVYVVMFCVVIILVMLVVQITFTIMRRCCLGRNDKRLVKQMDRKVGLFGRPSSGRSRLSFVSDWMSSRKRSSSDADSENSQVATSLPRASVFPSSSGHSNNAYALDDTGFASSPEGKPRELTRFRRQLRSSNSFGSLMDFQSQMRRQESLEEPVFSEQEETFSREVRSNEILPSKENPIQLSDEVMKQNFSFGKRFDNTEKISKISQHVSHQMFFPGRELP